MRKVFLGGNDFVFRRKMQNEADGTPALGLTLTCFFSATRTGAAIDALLSKAMVEGATEDGYRLYASTAVAPADLISKLTPFIGKVVYDRCEGVNYDDNEPVLVVDARPAGE